MIAWRTLCFLVFCAVMGAEEAPRTYCGRELIMVLNELCSMAEDNNPYTDDVTPDGPNLLWVQKNLMARDTLGQPSVVDQCCRKPCSSRQLMEFC